MSPPFSFAGVSRGDPSNPTSASGAAKHLFDALEERFEVAGRVNVELTAVQRALVAAVTFRLPRHRWRERFYKNQLAFELQSRNSGGLLSKLPAFDLAVQVYALFQTRHAPYVVYTDTTAELSRRYWPEWSPFGERGERAADGRERRVYRGASHLFCFTGDVAASLIEFYGVDPKRVTVVGGGLNFDEVPVANEAAREQLILFVGREWRRKGGDVLVDAFRQLRRTNPAATLAVVGTGELEPEPGIEVHGTLGRDAVASLYRRASIFALPSRYEPYGLAVCEAMAHGVACVTTRSGGMATLVIDGETGLFVPIDDAVALEAALSRLLGDPETARRMGAAGRERVQNELTWSRVVDRMVEPLEEAAARARAGRRP